MKLGISSLGHIIDNARNSQFKDPIDLQFNATEQCLNFAEINDIKIVELVVEPPHVLNDENKRKFINLINSYSIKKQVHGPYVDLSLCSYNNRIFEATIDSYINTINFCSQIKANIITIHPGLANFMLSSIREYNKKQLKNAIHKLLDFTNNQKLLICLENMPQNYHIMTDNANIDEVYNFIGREDLFMTFDTSHFYTCDGDVNHLWEKYGYIIKNVHIVDNFSKNSDTHPPIGSGKIDFNEIFGIFKDYNYNGPIIIELSSANSLNQSINFIKKFL